MFNIFKKKNKEELEKKEQETQAESAEKPITEKEVKINEDITVHTMPERFRFSHVKAGKTKKTGLFIITGGIIFLMVIIGGLYYYFFVIQPSGPSQTPEATSTPAIIEPESEPQPEADQPQAEEPEPGPIKSAKETYLEMKKEFDRINTFAAHEQLIREHGSKNRIVKLAEEKKEYNSLSKQEKTDFIDSIVKVAPESSEIENIKEIAVGNTAALYITIREMEEEGVIKMALEENQWKLEDENWPEAEESAAAEFTAAIDSDKDGLTDKEEILLGSLSNNTDSDGDGYDDLAEIMSLYNPTGTDKLINNSNISKYLNNSFNYNLLYPANWTFSTVGGDDSVMFRSSDNQFVQVIAQSNQSREPIVNWYKKQFDIATVDSTKLTITDNWQGIKSEDGLTIYLTDKQYSNIITITYIPSQDNVLDYMNIFEMVIKSLEISNL